MSLRMKRQATKPDDPGGSISKRKRRKLSGSEDPDSVTLAGGASSALLMGAAAGLWTPRHLGDLKAYNKKSTEKPGELIRKDLISAMKLPDSEYLSPDEYFEISDQWKQEWERGVQVPVNPDRLPHPKVSSLPAAPHHTQHDFRMPKKLVRVVHDDDYNPDLHHMSNAPARAEKSCRYDLDQLDSAWLHVLNGERARMGLPMVIDLDMERAVENMERQCWSKIQQIVKTHEGLSIEFDENVVCDVCQLPDSEEDNEMVFCDKCNICVHQTCYGITSIPDGSWLCKTCTLAIKPDCVLCPNKGGAMKSTRSGHKWAHVSCALWIPEVSIGDVEKMEPITKISNISARRWALVCVLCKEKIGACIQCSVKSCKTAYHVTCAFKHNLKMKPVEDESEEDEIKLKSYCQKHSKDEKLGADSDSEPGSTRHDPDFEAKKRTRKQKLQQIESEFYKHVDQREVSACCSMPLEAVDFIYNYWKLKRKSVHNKPLLPPAPDVMDARTEQQKQDLQRIKQFVHIRQNLEKVRNLCYMVTKRQKQLRNYFRLREQTLSGQAAVLRCRRVPLSEVQRDAVLRAGRCTDNVYDRHYSQSGADASAGCTVVRLTELLRGKGSAAAVGDVNGLVRGPDPYKKRYVNGAERRRSQLPSSASDSDTAGRQRDDGRRTPSLPPRPRITKQSLFGQDSSESGADSAGVAATCRGRASSGEQRVRQNKCGRPRTRPADHQPPRPASEDSDNKPLRVSAGTPHVLNTPARHIYTDSEDESAVTRTTAATAATAGAGSSVRTKAAMKAFSHHTPPAADPTDSRERRRKHHHHHHQPQEDIHGLLVPPRQAMLEANKKLSTTAQKSLVESTAAAVDTDAQQQKRSRGRSAKSPGRAPTPAGRHPAADVSDDGADNEAVARDVRLRRPEKQPFSSGGRSGHNHNKSQSSQPQHAATSPSSTAVGAAQRRHASSSSDSSSSSSSSSGSSSSSSSGSSSDDDAQAGRTADQLPASAAARSERRASGGRPRAESAESRPELAAPVAGHLSARTPPRPREPGRDPPAAESSPRQTPLGSGETAALRRVRPMPRSRKIALGLEPKLPQEDAAARRAEPLLADPVRPPLRGSIDSILSETQQEGGDTAVGTDAPSPRRSIEPPPALPLPVLQQSVFSPPAAVTEPVSLDLDADLLTHPPPLPPPAVLETKEESQQVTMDLVEKLRLQYAQQGPEDTPPTQPSPARSEQSKWRPLVSVQPEPESKPAHSVIPHLQQAERKVEPSPGTTVSSLPGKPPPPSMPAITEPPKPVQPVRPDAYKCDPPASQAQDLSRSLLDKQQPPAPATPILGPPAALFHQPPISMTGLFGQQPPLMPRSAMGAVNIRSPASINAAAAQYAAFAPEMMRAMMMQSAWAADGGQQLMEQLIMQSRMQFDPQQFLMQQSAEELCRKEEAEIKRRQEEEMRRRKEEAELERRRQEAEMQLRKEVVEERMRREEEERRRMEEEERRRMEEEERRRREEEERRLREEDERRRRDDEERRRRDDEERRRREEEERRRREEEERLRQEIVRREEEMRLRQEQEQQRLQALMAEQEAELRRTLLASSSAVQADKPPPALHSPLAVDEHELQQAPSASVQLALTSDSRLQSFIREQEVIAAEKLLVSQEQQRRQPPPQLEATKPRVEVVSKTLPEVAVDAATTALPMSPAAAAIPAVTQKARKKQPVTEPKSDSAPPRRARGRRECSVKATEQIHKLQHESEPADEERLPVRRGVARQLQEAAAAATARGGRGRRGAAPGARGRSRGRGKGRGATTPRSAPFCPLPQVPNDLAGTVYDFDDEFAEEPRPLPMRPLVRPSERRASTDRSSDRAPDDHDDEQLELPELDPLLLSSVSPAAAASVSMDLQPASHPPVLPSEQLRLPTAGAVPSDEPAAATTAAAPLQSVCDQRNQLLLKIKGPFMNPSYNAQQPPLVSALLAPATAAVNPNLRKRKKELIRQYVNSTETESAVESSAPAPDSGAGAPSGQRLSLSCPKAVKSVSQAPTRDDYTSALHARSAATGSAVSAAQMPKRRARHSNKETATAAPTAPAVSSATAAAGRKETARLTEVRPPKKRFETTTGLSVFEQIRQDNLKFGDQMLASFDDSGATTAAGDAPSSPPTSQHKKSKKKKKHKDKERKKDKHRASKVQLVNSEGAVAPRLIIKFGGRALDESADGSDGAAPAPPPLLAQVPPLALPSVAATTPLHKDLVVRIEPLSLDAAAADSSKLKPLKLKFSRRATAAATDGTTTPPPPTLSPETTPRPPESCHVR